FAAESEVSRTLSLENAIREVELGFCLLLSSIPNGGSLFLNAFAQAKNRHNKERWMSVCLDAATSTTASQRVEIFQRVLSGEGLVHVIVSPVDPLTRIKSEGREAAGKSVEQESAVGTEPYARPELETDYVAPRNEIERTIAAQWESILGIDRVGAHDNFFD